MIYSQVDKIKKIAKPRTSQIPVTWEEVGLLASLQLVFVVVTIEQDGFTGKYSDLLSFLLFATISLTDPQMSTGTTAAPGTSGSGTHDLYGHHASYPAVWLPLTMYPVRRCPPGTARLKKIPKATT